MIANNEILRLPKVTLETKELLPRYAGIYYVTDENKLIWYIGKAQNIYKRWQGKAHHRIYQLKQLKHKNFEIYYESISLVDLDAREKQQIRKYQPHLNNSPVKTKKVRPAETLLRETILAIADFAFVLGVEPPRRDIKDSIGISWLTQKQLIDLPIIHVCLDMTEFKTIFKPDSVNVYEALIKNAFNTRKAYSNKWDCYPKSYPFTFRLIANGYIIEVNYFSAWIGNDNTEIYREYNETEVAQTAIKVLTPENLNVVKGYNLASSRCKIQLERLQPYTSDLFPLFFNEKIDIESARDKLKKISSDFALGKRGVGSRNDNEDLDIAFERLLIERKVDPKKYNNDWSIRVRGRDKIGICIKSFSINLKQSRLMNINNKQVHLSVITTGILNNKLEHFQSSSKFDTVYLLAGVERKAWLLVEEYLQDFAKPSNKLTNGEGYTKKYYVSARKHLIPAKVNIKLETLKYSAWIPFGLNDEYPTFEAAKQEIKKRLEQANLPGLKLAFKKERATKIRLTYR